MKRRGVDIQNPVTNWAPDFAPASVSLRTPLSNQSNPRWMLKNHIWEIFKRLPLKRLLSNTYLQKRVRVWHRRRSRGICWGIGRKGSRRWRMTLPSEESTENGCFFLFIYQKFSKINSNFVFFSYTCFLIHMHENSQLCTVLELLCDGSWMSQMSYFDTHEWCGHFFARFLVSTMYPSFKR